jgi:prepilin-type N-terminal cleavage/methylation domain-containing protein
MKARTGFTLVEVLVGLVVASLALSAGFATLAFVRDRGEHAEGSARVMVGGATQRELLMDLLANARLRAPGGEQFEGVDQEENGQPLDQIMFPTTAATPLESAVTVVRLAIDVDPETPEEGLVAEMTGATLGQPAQRVVLVPQAASLNVRYLDAVPGMTEWTDGWSGRNQMPRGVELVLEPVRGDTLPTLLRLPIRVALGARW